MQALAKRLQTVPADVAAILRGFFLPKRYGNDFRLASEGAGLPSAAANMSLSYNTQSWEQATVTTLLPSTDYMVFLFANPLRAFILYYHNPSSAIYTYNIVSRSALGATFTIPLFIEEPLYGRLATPSTSFQPHGIILFPGHDEADHAYFYVSQADGAANGMWVTLNAPTAFANATTVKFYAWDGKHARLIQTTPMALAAQTAWLTAAALPAGGAYVYASITNADPSITTCTMGITGNSGVWGHHCVSDIQTLLNQAYGIRINSCSLRVQNDASPLNRNGNITAVTVSKAIPWTNFATSASALSGLQNYREFTADKGYYGIPLPDSDEDVSEFYPDICDSAFQTNTLNLFGYPLSERRPYKAVSFNIPIAAGRSLTFDVTHTMEYLTNNKIPEQKLSSVSEDSVRAAIVVASTQETDFENVANWRDALETVADYMQPSDSIGSITNQVAMAADRPYRR
jgi:hypothetical protein